MSMPHQPDSQRVDLIARLEKASGPDRELANEVLLACGWKINEYGDEGPTRSIEWVNPDPNGIDYLDGGQPDPTTSIDAAVTLVPDGYGWAVNSDRGRCCANYRHQVTGAKPDFPTSAATPAIALCIAALRARAEGRTP